MKMTAIGEYTMSRLEELAAKWNRPIADVAGWWVEFLARHDDVTVCDFERSTEDIRFAR